MKRFVYLFFILILLLLATAWVAVSWGQAGMISLADLLQNKISSEFSTIVWHIRMPRTILAILVGANLAVAGALMQALFNNPLAEPHLVGISSGAALGAALAVTIGLQATVPGSIAWFAFAGAIGAALLVYSIARRSGGVSAATLLLTGIAVGGLLQAFTTVLLMHSSDNQLRSIMTWLMGSLAYKDWNYVTTILPYSIIGIIAACFSYRTLNSLASGEETAYFLGVRVEFAKIFLLLVAALLAAVSVAVSGIIGFVGLMVPHIVRMIVGANHAFVLPASVLSGGLLLLWSGLIARNVISGQETPIGIVTAVLGCLFFLYLLRKQKKIASRF